MAALFLGCVIAVVVSQSVWSSSYAADSDPRGDAQDSNDEPDVLELSPQARKNLNLISAPVKIESHWRTIQVPGTIADRPGISDRGVTSPAAGVVTKVHAFAGDTIRPNEVLFTLKVFSEYLQKTQSELFKATREKELLNQELARLENVARGGAIPGSRIIALEQQVKRQEGLIKAYRQDLLTRGLQESHLTSIAKGEFVLTIDVVAPEPIEEVSESEGIQQDALVDDDVAGPIYEVQELEIQLGQQVQAGQLLSVLANHRSLYIEGHAFKHDAPLLAQAAKNGWPIKVDFGDEEGGFWPVLNKEFQIRHLANTVDRDSHTFDFFLPFENQSRTYERDGQQFVVWRYRPGERVRLLVPVEELQDVIVLPAGAVVREGPEAYVFQQNGDLFNRLPVHVLHEDRSSVVIANDGSVSPGFYLAQNSAASLNRVLKAQSASGQAVGVHVHADGTVHAAH